MVKNLPSPPNDNKLYLLEDEEAELDQALLGLNRAHVPNHLTKDVGLELYLEGCEDFTRAGRAFDMREQPSKGRGSKMSWEEHGGNQPSPQPWSTFTTPLCNLTSCGGAPPILSE